MSFLSEFVCWLVKTGLPAMSPGVFGVEHAQLSSFIESNTLDERFSNLLVLTVISSDMEDNDPIPDSLDELSERRSKSTSNELEYVLEYADSVDNVDKRLGSAVSSLEHSQSSKR